MRVVYHRGRSQIASTSESYGGDLIYKGLIGVTGKLDRFSAHIRLREPDKSKDKVDPATRWRRPCMRVAVCLSIDQEELLGGHSGVETGGRKGRGSNDESSGAQLPKSKASVKKEVDSEERHSAAEADLPIAKGYRCKATDSRAMGLAALWYRRDETSVESLIPCSHGGRALVVKRAEEVENAEANSKCQDRAEGQRSRNFIRPMSIGFSLR
ncbi:hypothetical protein GW17_00050728 [Ensete ventricosum]|nr:hypothetical protein GW17_00050728 [Ensete ventricosum]